MHSCRLNNIAKITSALTQIKVLETIVLKLTQNLVDLIPQQNIFSAQQWKSNKTRTKIKALNQISCLGLRSQRDIIRANYIIRDCYLAVPSCYIVSDR